MSDRTSDTQFDQALITAAFTLAAESGWAAVSVAAAARAAGLPLERARARFRDRTSILMRFGRHADEAALTGVTEDGSPRDRLFDMLMRRFDAMQSQRDGIRALLHAIPTDPGLAILMGATTSGSMAWMLGAAGLKTSGLSGLLRTKGLTAVWLYTLRAWERDDTADLSGTMAALDRALSRAERLGSWLEGGAPASSEPKPFPDYPPDGSEDPAGAI
jgi:hypothetical protein